MKEPTLTEARDQLARMFPGADFISVKRQEYIDIRAKKPSVTFQIHVNNWGAGPERKLSSLMKVAKQWNEGSL